MHPDSLCKLCARRMRATKLLPLGSRQIWELLITVSKLYYVGGLACFCVMYVEARAHQEHHSWRVRVHFTTTLALVRGVRSREEKKKANCIVRNPLHAYTRMHRRKVRGSWPHSRTPYIHVRPRPHQPAAQRPHSSHTGERQRSEGGKGILRAPQKFDAMES